jgi:hypothetical protein
MTKQRMTHSLFLILTAIWWGWTVLIDMVTIPTIFKTIDDFFIAGNLGIALFSQLNILEVVCGSALVALAAVMTRNDRNKLIIFILSLLTFTIALYFLTYLTPKIATLTALWKHTDLMGLSGTASIPDIQQEHQFFHELYIGLDVVKLIGLTGMLGLVIIKSEKSS